MADEKQLLSAVESHVTRAARVSELLAWGQAHPVRILPFEHFGIAYLEDALEAIRELEARAKDEGFAKVLARTKDALTAYEAMAKDFKREWTGERKRSRFWRHFP